jgi:sugar phosphate isomerase/epimerase
MTGVRPPIGNQTAFSASNWLDPFRFALNHGFGAFEWFSDRRGDLGWAFSDCDGGCRAYLAAQGRDAGMVFTVHAPWDSNPSDPWGRAQLRSSLDFARDVGARIVVQHLPSPEREAAWVASMADPVHWAEQAELVFALENTVETSPADVSRVLTSLRRQHGSNAPVTFCLDIGHANLCAATRNDYVGFFDALGPELPIVHMHLHENWGDQDQHLVLFTGPSAHHPEGVSSLLGRLRARDYRGVFILEQWPQPPELLLNAAERLKALW